MNHKLIIIIIMCLIGVSDVNAQKTRVQVVRDYIDILNEMAVSKEYAKASDKLGPIMLSPKQLDDGRTLACRINDFISDSIMKEKNLHDLNDVKAETYIMYLWQKRDQTIRIEIVSLVDLDDYVIAKLKFSHPYNRIIMERFYFVGNYIISIDQDRKYDKLQQMDVPENAVSQHISPSQQVQQQPQTETQQQIQQPTSGTHQYVDLGIGTLWATTNVGADNPWDYGDYFAWGETTPKSNYSWSTLKYCEANTGDKFSKYNTKSKYGKVDNKTTLDPSDDAATANWGSEWRMPTADERDALISKCYWVWTENYHGTKGYIVYKALKESDKGKKIYIFNGGKVRAAYSPDRVAHIFLPAAGWKGKDGTTSGLGSGGDYWSSSLSTDDPNGARGLDFCSGDVSAYGGYRYYGNSVRPVRCSN